jgi:hypothetical protein
MKNGQTAVRIGILVAGFGLLAGTIGCSGDAGGPGEATANGENALVTRTLVTLNPDGTATIAHETVPLSQQRGEIAARLQAAANPASAGTLQGGGTHPNTAPSTQPNIGTASCSDPAVSWMFSGTNLTGHQLCLMGAGSAALWTYVMSCGPLDPDNPPYGHCQTWEGKIKSYWMGASGAFRKNGAPISWPDDAPNWVSFAYWEQVNSVAAPSYEICRLDY